MTTMIQSEDPTLHIGIVGADVWGSAVEEIVDGEVPTDDPDKLAFWEAPGILADGKLDEMWGRAIRIAQTSVRGTEIISRYGDVVFAATVLVDRAGEWATCATTRAAVGVNEEGVEVVEAVHPMLEIAIAPADRLWALIRRVLPPLDALRHEPRVTLESEAKRITLDGVEIPEEMKASPETFAQHLMQLPFLPPQFYDIADPEASVFTYTLDADSGKVRTSSRTWALGRKLYLIDADTASIWEVPPGDVGSSLLQALGR